MSRSWIVCLLWLCCVSAFAQETIVPNTVLDSTGLDSIQFRVTQIKISYIPRGVHLTNPVVSFNQTKPLREIHSKFRIPSFWQKENNLSFSLSEVAFVNWNAGGNSSISGTGNLRFIRNYKFRYIQWDSDLELKYGINAQEGRELQKTDDAIRMSSTFGYRPDTLSNWYYSVKINFLTQFADGYKYPDTSTPISRFMAPGYLFFGAGTSFIPVGKQLNLYFSPTTLRATFVLDQKLANKGSFGVDGAILDDEGNILQEGKNSLVGFGFLITNTWENKIAKNVALEHRLGLYTDYIHSFGNIDVNWELNLNLTVNEFIAANIGTHIIYDDDILFDQEFADDGTIINPGRPKIQFKQVLGIGILYSF